MHENLTNSLTQILKKANFQVEVFIWEKENECDENFMLLIFKNTKKKKMSAAFVAIQFCNKIKEGAKYSVFFYFNVNKHIIFQLFS